MDTPVLSINELNVTFHGNQTFHALRNISFDLFAGKTLALLGKSGSGKSVCSLAIMQLLPKSATITGSIQLNGHELLDNGERINKVRGNQVSMIFQEPMSALNPVKTCGKQLLECITIHNKQLDKKSATLKALHWMEKVQLPNPTQLFNRYPHEISGGQKQRLMIAMAMCNEPALLIADEPTTALDVLVQKDIIALMRSLQQEYNTAIIFITHDMALAKLIADDIVVFENGAIAADQAILKVNKAQLHHNLAATNSDNAILSVNDIYVSYNNKQQFSLFKKKHSQVAVADVSFDIQRGETLGLVGGSGCGKSTISKTILGLAPIDSGSIYLCGQRIDNEWHKKMPTYRKSVQMIFQDPYASLNPRISVEDMLREILVLHKIVDKSKVEKRIHSLLDQVGLPAASKEKYPHEFSGGQRQRLCIARALAVEPALIICDESVAALDIQLQQQIIKLLNDLQKVTNISFLFISHDIKIVEQIANRILVMEKGKIVEENSSYNIIHYPQHEYTKQLINAVV